MFDQCDAIEGAADAGCDTEDTSLLSTLEGLWHLWCEGLGPLFSCRLWRGDASLACATMRSTTASDSLSILRDTTLDATEYCERASQSTEGVAVLPRVGVAATGTTMLRDLSKSNSSAMAENFACLQANETVHI